MNPWRVNVKRLDDYQVFGLSEIVSGTIGELGLFGFLLSMKWNLLHIWSAILLFFVINWVLTGWGWMWGHIWSVQGLIFRSPTKKIVLPVRSYHCGGCVELERCTRVMDIIPLNEIQSDVSVSDNVRLQIPAIIDQQRANNTYAAVWTHLSLLFFVFDLLYIYRALCFDIRECSDKSQCPSENLSLRGLVQVSTPILTWCWRTEVDLFTVVLTEFMTLHCM